MRRRPLSPVCLIERILLGAVLAALALPAPALAAPPGLDAGFGTDGVATVSFGTFDLASGMATAPDGKIVIVGTVSSSQSTFGDFAVVRLNSDGTLDQTFGSGGKRTIDFKPTGSESWADYASDVVVQPDGKIVVAGTSKEPTTDNRQMTITRLNADDGSTDLTFGDPSNPGVEYIGLCDNGTETRGIDRFANGRLVAGAVCYASASQDIGWGGLSQIGQEDPISGSIDGASVEYAEDVAVTPDGNFVVVGGSNGGPDSPYDILVVRRKGTDGSQDNTFNGNGRQYVGYGGIDSGDPMSVAVQPDGKVVVAGVTYAASDGSDFLVQRLTAAGSPDTSFSIPGNQGTAFIDFGGSESPQGLKVLPDGKIAVAGDNASDVVVARLTGSGALDSSFGVGGKRTIALANDQNASAGLAVQPDGGFLVAGTTYGSASDFFVMRIGKFTPRRGPAGTSPGPAAPGLAKVAVSGKSLRASAKGVVSVKVRCSAAAACRGTVDLTTARKVSVSAKKRKLKLARKSYSVAAGRSKTVKLKLRRSGLKLLRKRRKLRVRLTVTTRRAGAKAAKVGRTVTLSAARKKKGKR